MWRSLASVLLVLSIVAASPFAAATTVVAGESPPPPASQCPPDDIQCKEFELRSDILGDALLTPPKLVVVRFGYDTRGGYACAYATIETDSKGVTPNRMGLSERCLPVRIPFGAYGTESEFLNAEIAPPVESPNLDSNPLTPRSIDPPPAQEAGNDLPSPEAPTIRPVPEAQLPLSAEGSVPSSPQPPHGTGEVAVYDPAWVSSEARSTVERAGTRPSETRPPPFTDVTLQSAGPFDVDASTEFAAAYAERDEPRSESTLVGNKAPVRGIQDSNAQEAQITAPSASTTLRDPPGFAEPLSLKSVPAPDPQTDGSQGPRRIHAARSILPPLTLLALAVAALATALLLYTRLSAQKLLAHPLRREIHARVQSAEGVSAERIAQDLAVHPTTVTYHLRRLERAGYVKRHAAGRCEYWTTPEAKPALAKLEATQSGLAREIAVAVASAPGANTAQVAVRTGASKRLALYHLRKLEAAGLLRDGNPAGRAPQWFPVA